MKAIKSDIHRLATELQEWVGFAELEKYPQAIDAAKKAIHTMHILMTAISTKVAELDEAIADLQAPLAEAAMPKRKKSGD